MGLAHQKKPDLPTDMLQYFLVDLNCNGSYYQIGVYSTNKDVVERELMKWFRDVRFMYEKKKKNRDKVTGYRKMSDNLIIGYCSYSFDINNTFSNYRVEFPPDRRHKVG